MWWVFGAIVTFLVAVTAICAFFQGARTYETSKGTYVVKKSGVYRIEAVLPRNEPNPTVPYCPEEEKENFLNTQKKNKKEQQVSWFNAHIAGIEFEEMQKDLEKRRRKYVEGAHWLGKEDDDGK